MLQVDVATRILPAGHKVFIMHPGEGKKFYDTMFATSRVFLDAPGVTFGGLISSEDRDLLDRHLISRAVRRWHLTGRPEEAVPSRNPTDYAHHTLTSKRRVQLQSIMALYNEAQPGDLVVVTGPGYNSKVLIGEIQTPYNLDDTIFVEAYPNDPIPIRQVKWLSTNRPKGSFSTRMIEYMIYQKAIIRPRELPILFELYREVYKDFILPDYSEGRIEVTKEHIDLLKFSQSSQAIIYAAALYRAAELGAVEAAADLPVSEAINQYYSDQQLIDTGISINSPGFIALKARELALPLYIGVLLALGAAGVTLDEARAAELVNSESGQPVQCEIEMEERFRGTLNGMSYEAWRKWCIMAQSAANGIGLRAHPKVRPKPRPVLRTLKEGPTDE